MDQIFRQPTRLTITREGRLDRSYAGGRQVKQRIGAVKSTNPIGELTFEILTVETLPLPRRVVAILKMHGRQRGACTVAKGCVTRGKLMANRPRDHPSQMMWCKMASIMWFWGASLGRTRRTRGPLVRSKRSSISRRATA